ncbi:TerB family tellurite resistance protein [Roseovarius dicentrarchi]|uniref:tellurite resistance TerB family protein n=1 Tax=Roseovarius dicentrarchi TaxID=2250573 RepID=UPI001EF07AE3|nr:TerB family tellurite resistance protein [Roseovarius dicentrarchi]
MLAPPPKGGKRGTMISRILNLFKGHPPDPLPEADARLALGALMVRFAKSAEDAETAAAGGIDTLLARMCALGPADAAKMRATCEKIEAEAPSTRKFALLIRETVSFEARIEALEALWHVMLAGGRPGDADQALIAQIREALGLSRADSDAAQQRAAPL